MPTTADGIGAMLLSFDTNINANGGALATKYGIAAAERTRVTQARPVWAWFQDALTAARDWAQSLTQIRDTMTSAPQSAAGPLPGGSVLPAVPTLTGPPPAPALLEPGFFTFFSSLAARIKANENYDPADGTLLGIEGAQILPLQHHAVGESGRAGDPVAFDAALRIG